MSRPPVRKFSLGNISIAAFESDKGNITFAMPQKRQKNQAGEWESAKTLFATDLVVIKMLCDAASRWMMSQENSARREVSPSMSAPATVGQAPFADDDIPF